MADDTFDSPDGKNLAGPTNLGARSGISAAEREQKIIQSKNMGFINYESIQNYAQMRRMREVFFWISILFSIGLTLCFVCFVFLHTLETNPTTVALGSGLIVPAVLILWGVMRRVFPDQKENRGSDIYAIEAAAEALKPLVDVLKPIHNFFKP